MILYQIKIQNYIFIKTYIVLDFWITFLFYAFILLSFYFAVSVSRGLFLKDQLLPDYCW